MFGDGGRTMRQSAAQMRRYALAVQENLDGPGSDPGLNVLTDETVRNAVVVLGDLDVIIEIDATALPLRILLGLVRQRQQGRAIELVEELTPAAAPAPQRATSSGRPGSPGHICTNASILATSRTIMSRSCCALSGPTSSRSIGKRKP
jgi:hypothetical protein